MAYKISEELEKDAPRSVSNANYFNIEPGNTNICRVLTRGKEVKKHFLGKGNPKPVCYGYEEGCPVRKFDEQTKEMLPQHADTFGQYIIYVLDRSDDKVKMAFFPRGVMIAVGMLQDNPDYAFDDMPMPYDLRITWSPDEKDPKNKYRTEVKPNGADLTPKNLAELDAAMAEISPEQMRDKMIEKQKNNDEKNGRRKTKEEIEKEAVEYHQKSIEADKEVQSQNAVEGPTIEYPKDEISVDDIPF